MMTYRIAVLIASRWEYLIDRANRGVWYAVDAEPRQVYERRWARFDRYVWDRYGVSGATIHYHVNCGRAQALVAYVNGRQG